MKEIYAPCGIDCGDCKVYQATTADDPEIRKVLADEFKANFGKEIDPASILCDGCFQAGRHIGFCAVCEIRFCATDKGYATCAECTELPCEKGQFIWLKNSVSLANLEKMKPQS